jgi:hypothetical protein
MTLSTAKSVVNLATSALAAKLVARSGHPVTTVVVVAEMTAVLAVIAD